MEQGVVFGRSMLGYDVKGGKMYINEEGAKIVRLIFHKFVKEGKGTHVIARELREEGIAPMRVKEWQNTVILRVIRNEKYCGDLVQKKTYTPDFLSHEKKYNRGQEEFVIIKDHHEPIVSRELFDEANRILDEKSLSQEGKAKHSSRYPFSGKMKCGCCGASYVARYKTRQDGSRYKAWRCNEAAKHGSPHTDKAGNKVGCSGISIRNEDATHIMYLVMKELKLNQTKITDKLISVIEPIIATDWTGTDIEKLKGRMDTMEEKRTKLIDIYMSSDITKEEFHAARSKCDAEISELKSVIDSIGRQQTMTEKQQELMREIRDAMNEIVNGVEYDDEFYKHILDKMVIGDRDNIDVYLNLLPMKWSYTVAKSTKVLRMSTSKRRFNMNDIIKAIENEQLKSDITDFNVGDTVKVYAKVIEGSRERIQVYEGTVLKRQNGGARETFTVRKLSNGVGVEKTWPLHSPIIDKIEVVRRGKARRAKLFYLRDRVGKAAKVKEIVK